MKTMKYFYKRENFVLIVYTFSNMNNLSSRYFFVGHQVEGSNKGHKTNILGFN